jgi:hypothetical protein
MGDADSAFTRPPPRGTIVIVKRSFRVVARLQQLIDDPEG